MSEGRVAQSILAADIGSTLTHLALIERVEGVYRLTARAETPTVSGSSQTDLQESLKQGLERLQYLVQRPLLGSDRDLLAPASGRPGVDLFVATVSAAPPLDCALIGLTADLSLESGKRVCTASNARIVRTISLVNDRPVRHQALLTLRDTPPDVIVLVGGVDRGPTGPLESAAQILATLFSDVEPSVRPVIVMAGNQEARRPIADILGDQFDYRVVDNVRPDLNRENPQELQRELAQIYTDIAIPRLTGYSQLADWADAPILSSSMGLRPILSFMGRQGRWGQHVLGVDVGGQSTLVALADEDGYYWSHLAQIGTAQGVESLLEVVGIPQIERWLTTPADGQALTHQLQNVSLRPQNLPESLEEMLVLQAAAREAIGLALDRLPEFGATSDANMCTVNLIAARGGILTQITQYGCTALTLLDGIQPSGVTRLVLDWASLWPQLGALAQIEPLAALQVLEHDALLELGTVIAVRGQGTKREAAVQIYFLRENGENAAKAVPFDSIGCIALKEGETATIDARPSRHIDIGLGRPGQGGRTTVHGGRLGLIIDARGRPISLPVDHTARRQKIESWHQDLCS